MNNHLDINAQTKIGELLKAYPQLEEVLLRLSPSFGKLKNPVLRKTIGRIASLRQAAEIGCLNVGEMISTLRTAVGMDESYVNTDLSDEQQVSKPKWIDTANVSLTFDASDIIKNGGSPMKSIMEKAGQLHIGEVLLLITPFQPIPIIELLNSKGYRCWSESNQNKVYTYIKK